MKLFVLLAIVSSLSAASVNFVPFYKLPTFNFTWPSEGKINYRQGLVATQYGPRYTFVDDIAVYGDRLIISFLKNNGIPAVAFTWMDLASHFPNLHPFPSLKMLEKGNCASIQNVNAIKVDSRGRLWVVDRNWNCRSRIWIFDLNDNDEVVFVHDLPDYIFPYEYLGGTIVTMELHEEKDDTLAFIVDNNYESKVHVFSLKSKEMWFVCIRGSFFLSGPALSTIGQNKLLYLSSWERDKPGLYSVLVSDLIGRKNDSIIPSFIGNKSTNSYKLIMDRKGMLYYDVRDKNVLCSWDTNLPFKEEVVFEDDETIPDTRWDSRYTIDELDDVWLLARFDGGFKLFTSGVVAELVDRKFDNNEETDDFVPYHVEHHLVLD